MRAQFSDGEEDDGEEDDGEEDGELEGGEEEEDADGCRNCFSCLKAIPSGALVCLRAEPHNGAAIVCSACAPGFSADGEWMTFQLAFETVEQRCMQNLRQEMERRKLLKESMPHWYRLKVEDAESRAGMAEVARRMYEKERHGQNWEGDGVWPLLANPRGHQLYRSPRGFPMCCDGAVCDQTNTHHFMTLSITRLIIHSLLSGRLRMMATT